MLDINPNLICVYISSVLVLAGGLYVFIANPHRLANQVFLQISTSLLIWLLIIGNTFIAKTPESALFWFRLTNFSSLFVLLSIYYMRVAVVYQDKSIWRVAIRSRSFTLATIAVALLTLTPIFSTSMKMGTGLTVPQPVYGPGVIVFGLFAIISGITIFVKTLFDIKLTEGLRRIELQYIALGSAVGWGVGLAMTTGVQVFSPGSDAIIYSPLATLSLHLIIAYGIATKRLMGVADVLRRFLAYSLLLAYLLVVYGGIVWIVRSILPKEIANSSEIPLILGSLAVIASVAPVGNYFRKFTNLLFVRLETLDGRRALRNFNNFVRTVKTIPQLLENFATFLGETLGTDRVVILLPNGDTFIQSYPLIGKSEKTINISQQNKLVQYLERSSEPISSEVIQRQRSEDPISHLGNELVSLNASIATAVRSKDNLLAILLLGPRLSGQIYSLNEQNLLHTLANSFGLAIENSVYLTEVENAKIYNDILLDNLLSGVIATDANGTISVYNKEAERLLAIETSEIIGKEIDALPVQIATLIHETQDLCLLSETSQLHFETKSGNIVPMRISRTVVRGHAGQRVGTLLVFDDESDIRQLEGNLRRSDRLARIGTLSATMAHKIRVPLLIIKNLLEKLPENFDNEVFRNNFFKTVVSEVTSIDSSVRDLLQFAKPKAPESKPISVHKIIEKSLESITLELQEKNIVVLKKFNKETDIIEGSDELIRQVFISYFLYALEEMGSAGTFTITTTLEQKSFDPNNSDASKAVQSCLVIAISDTSKRRVDAEKLPQIVNAIDNDLGIGLEIAKDILADHGGILEMELGKTKGRTVYFSFPLPKQNMTESLEHN